MSGEALFNHSNTLAKRALTELTFQVAMRGMAARYIENEVPQPHDAVAFGFFT